MVCNCFIYVFYLSYSIVNIINVVYANQISENGFGSFHLFIFDDLDKGKENKNEECKDKMECKIVDMAIVSSRPVYKCHGGNIAKNDDVWLFHRRYESVG